MNRSRPALVWVALLFAYTSVAGLHYKNARREARPYEPGHIAEALAGGHGFSFPVADEWFFLRPAGDTTSFWPARLFGPKVGAVTGVIAGTACWPSPPSRV